ncbi:MAG: tetratricopeptide repeat protein [Terracidiphilus sp.]
MPAKAISGSPFPEADILKSTRPSGVGASESRQPGATPGKSHVRANRSGALRFQLALSALLSVPLVALPQTAKKKPAPDVIKLADAAFREGYVARQDGNLELARTKFAEVVRLQPNIAEGHEALGAVLVESGKPLDGALEFEAAETIKPSDDGIETNLALAYYQAGQFSKAIPHFESAVSLSQQAGHAAPVASFYDAYGHALAAAGKPDQAVLQFVAEEAITGPRSDIEDAIGTLDAQRGNWQEAQKRLERAISLDSTNIRAQIHLGLLFLAEKDFVDAVNTLSTAAATNPPNAEALMGYGRALAAAGKDEEAVQQFNAAIQADTNFPGVPLELAMALQRLGRQQEAIPWFQKALEQQPHNPSLLTNLALALTLTGKGKEALDYFKLALAENANDPTVYKDLGVCHIQLSAFDEAIADFQKAMALDLNDPQLHYDLGLAYKFKDRPNDAIAELSRAGQMDPNLQDPPYTLGILYMQLGKLDDAVVELKKAVALRPANGDAWAILGSTLKQDSRLPEAAEALEKAIPLLPGQPGPRVTLAGVLAEQAGDLNTQADAAEAAGDQKKADALRSEMRQLRAQAADYRKEAALLAQGAVSRQRAHFALNAGNQLMLRGQIADAIARYQESVAADSTFADAHTQLAIAYERQGRPVEAAAERAKAAELSKAQ